MLSLPQTQGEESCDSLDHKTKIPNDVIKLMINQLKMNHSISNWLIIRVVKFFSEINTCPLGENDLSYSAVTTIPLLLDKKTFNI